MTRSLAIAFSLLLLVLPTAWAHAKDCDGLDPAARKVLYNDQTAFVTRIELAGLGQDRINQALVAMFYPNRAASAKPLVDQAAGSTEKIVSEPRLLGLLGFTHVTTVGIDRGSGAVALFHVVELGPKLQDDSTFNLWKFGLEGPVKDFEITKLGTCAVFVPKGNKLPAAAGYRASVAEAVQLGLTQAPANATVNWVLLPRKATQDLVQAMLGAESNWAELTGGIGGATYCGGYLTTGTQPELAVYVRLSTEAKAAEMKRAFDQVVEKEVARGVQIDQEVEARLAKLRSQGVDTSGEEAELAKFPKTAETMKRFLGALPTQAFGPVFMLKLRQRDLQEITATIQDALQGKQ